MQNEASAQVGSIVNCMFNRDAMTHTHINYIGSGLPLKLQKRLQVNYLALVMLLMKPKTTHRLIKQKSPILNGPFA